MLSTLVAKALGVAEKVSIIVLGILLISLALFGLVYDTRVRVSHIEEVQVPYEVTVTKEYLMGRTRNTILPGGYYYAYPLSSDCVIPNRVIILTWDGDGDLRAYIFTEAQFNDFKVFGVARGWEAFGYGKSGTISLNISHVDNYYAVVYNPWPFTRVKLYGAEAKLIWSETEVRTRTETHVRYEEELRVERLVVYAVIGVIGVIVLIKGVRLLRAKQYRSTHITEMGT